MWCHLQIKKFLVYVDIFFEGYLSVGFRSKYIHDRGIFPFSWFSSAFLDFWRKNLNFFPVRRGGAHIIWFFSKFGKPNEARAPDILEKFFVWCMSRFFYTITKRVKPPAKKKKSCMSTFFFAGSNCEDTYRKKKNLMRVDIFLRGPSAKPPAEKAKKFHRLRRKHSFIFLK